MEQLGQNFQRNNRPIDIVPEADIRTGISSGKNNLVLAKECREKESIKAREMFELLKKSHQL